MKLEFKINGPVELRVLKIQESKPETTANLAHYTIDAEVMEPGIRLGWCYLKHTGTPRHQQFRKEGFGTWTMYPQGDIVSTGSEDGEAIYYKLEAALQRRKWNIEEQAPLRELAETEL